MRVSGSVTPSAMARTTVVDPFEGRSRQDVSYSKERCDSKLTRIEGPAITGVRRISATRLWAPSLNLSRSLAGLKVCSKPMAARETRQKQRERTGRTKLKEVNVEALYKVDRRL